MGKTYDQRKNELRQLQDGDPLRYTDKENKTRYVVVQKVVGETVFVRPLSNSRIVSVSLDDLVKGSVALADWKEI